MCYQRTCNTPSLVRKLNVPKCFSSSSWMARGVYAGVYLKKKCETQIEWDMGKKNENQNNTV